jgi:pimeloyl-ACP methyl ester carboxylesterase
MKPSTMPAFSTATADEDMAQQARPDHGIPSQDLSSVAQAALPPQEAAREATSELKRGGIVQVDSSGQRIHRTVPHSPLVKVDSAPYGLNVSHAQAFNDALLSLLRP